MILLYSGGADSYIAWEFLHRPKTLYNSLGHRYQEHEMKAIMNTIPDTIIDKSLYLGIWEHADADIPMRNAFLCMVASYYDNDIVLVVQKGEMSIPDRSLEFFDLTEKYVSFLHNNKKITVTSPFFNMTKTQMVRWYVEAGLSINKLLRTRSCYSNSELPCGQCGACFRRWVSFTVNGIEEKMENDILKWEQTPLYIEKMKAGKYDGERVEETFLALKIKGYDI